MIDQVWRAAVGGRIEIIHSFRERRCRCSGCIQVLSLILFRKGLALSHHAPHFVSEDSPLILGIPVWPGYYESRAQGVYLMVHNSSKVTVTASPIGAVGHAAGRGSFEVVLPLSSRALRRHHCPKRFTVYVCCLLCDLVARDHHCNNSDMWSVNFSLKQGVQLHTQRRGVHC